MHEEDKDVFDVMLTQTDLKVLTPQSIRGLSSRSVSGQQEQILSRSVTQAFQPGVNRVVVNEVDSHVNCVGSLHSRYGLDLGE